MRPGARRLFGALILVGVTPFTVVTALAAERDRSHLSFSIGLDYSTGEYGAETSTDVWYVPFTTKYKTRRVTYKLTVPYLEITGPGVVAGGEVIIGAGTGERGTESGVGDFIGSTFFKLSLGAGKAPAIDFGIKVKFATADEEKGLGTGKEDLSLQLDLADQLGKAAIFGTLGYKWRGDPEELELDNGAFASVGVGRRFGPKISGGLMFDFKGASSEGNEDKRALILYLSQRLNKKRNLVWYVLGGVSESSPDAEVGMQFSYKR